METHTPQDAVRGFLDPFSETGTEGVVWSFSDPGLPGYHSLHPLEDGDWLRVSGPDGAVLWEGAVSLEYRRSWHPYPGTDISSGGKPPGQQAVMGMWVHGLQRDMDPERWAGLFFARHRALCRKAGPSGEPHPFDGPADGMEERLHSLEQRRAEDLFRSALYPWLAFYSDGGWFSLAREWNMSLEDTFRLLEEPTPARLLAWRTYPKSAGASLLPFSLDVLARLAFLFRVHRELMWRFPTAAARAAWLDSPFADAETARSLLLQPGLDGVRRVGEHLREALAG